MRRVGSILVFMMLMIVLGCTAGTSSTRQNTGVPNAANVPCGTIDGMTDEQYRFCNGGSNR